MRIEKSINHASGVIPRLNAVRLLVVLLIAMGYASTMPIGPAERETGTVLGFEPSWIGIQILFFISGALAYKSVESGRIGVQYIKSRIRRVFPVLLAVTLTAVLVIYPLMGKPMTGAGDALTLAKYFFLTVSCLSPGRVLPGLLDDSLYACLIQGAIWTLRWGLILHIGIAAVSHFKVLTQPRVILAASLLATALYLAGSLYIIKFPLDVLPAPLIGLRFGYVFLLGMAIWAYREHLPRHWILHTMVVLGLFCAAALSHVLYQWEPVAEVCLTLSVAYGVWLTAMSKTSKLEFLSQWPNLAIGLYMVNWPTTQVLLYKYPHLDSTTLPLVSLPLALMITVICYAISTSALNKMSTVSLTRKVPV